LIMATEKNQTIHLYSGRAPGSEDWHQRETESTQNSWNTRVVTNVTDPTLTVFAPIAGRANGAAVVICPGGGFHGLSIDSEGNEVARWLAVRGVTCFVLKYRLVSCKTADPGNEMAGLPMEEIQHRVMSVIPLAHADGLAALRYVRTHSQTYGVDPQRIGIVGFSAGGTVTASVAFTHEADSRPNFSAPIYLQYTWVIKADVPNDATPMFLLAATDDALGLASHSVRLYTDWIVAGQSAELHLYSRGGHGFGMRVQHLPSDGWIELFWGWLVTMGFAS
jgi:acetyl esterase/lipase